MISQYLLDEAFMSSTSADLLESADVILVWIVDGNVTFQRIFSSWWRWTTPKVRIAHSVMSDPCSQKNWTQA
jgi:uncharacterized membrane protein